ncbi:MAG: thioredoxin family protein [Reyranellaceae bacterium]
MRRIDSKQLFQLLDQKKPRVLLVYFTESGCPPCTRMAPVAQALAQEFAARLTTVELNPEDDYHDMSRRWGLSTVPAFALCKEGQPRAFNRSPRSQPEIRSWIEAGLA